MADIQSKLESTFENKDKMLDIACDILLSKDECPLKHFNADEWRCEAKEEYPLATTCIRCIRLYLKYLAESDNY